MAKTVQPRIDPLAGGGGRPPIDDERELLETGTQGIASNIACLLYTSPSPRD